MQVTVTGAGGRIGTRVLDALAERHDVTPVDRRALELAGWETTVADVTDPEATATALAGQDCVVHLAAESASEATWEEVREPNLDGTWNVFRAAVENGLDRVVFASSNHATHMYNVADPGQPRSQRPPAEARPVAPDEPPRPSGPYGVTKIAGEAIGSYHADRHGIEVVNLRIGWVLDREALVERQSTPLADYARAMWLSPRDCREGLSKAISASLPENPLTVNLLSANAERYLSLVEAMRALDYRPRDDSAEVVGRGHAG
jgi:L-arabinose 1-dehydrogenase [NAD(P)+]